VSILGKPRSGAGGDVHEEVSQLPGQSRTQGNRMEGELGAGCCQHQNGHLAYSDQRAAQRAPWEEGQLQGKEGKLRPFWIEVLLSHCWFSRTSLNSSGGSPGFWDGGQSKMARKQCLLSMAPSEVEQAIS
jgi:hypothetical protein